MKTVPLLLCPILVFLGCTAPEIRFTREPNPLAREADSLPENVDQCLERLKKELDRSTLEEIKGTEEKQLFLFHYSLGQWMRNNWIKHSMPLYAYFRRFGIVERDDMSGIILVSLWRSLNNRPIDLEKQFEAKLHRQ